jgi:carboxymethylenebutenolidase
LTEQTDAVRGTEYVAVTDAGMELLVVNPSSGEPDGAVLLIMEAFGVNDHIKDVARRLAAEGFLVVVPDFFHRFEARQVPYSDVAQAIELCCRLSNEQLVQDVSDGIEWIECNHPGTRVATVGFCFGGRTGYLAAARLGRRLSGTVVFYGGAIASDIPVGSQPVLESSKIAAPLLALFGELDTHIPADEVDAIESALVAAGVEHEIVRYPDAGHGFHCDARPNHYDPLAARDAWSRTVAFLKTHLRERASA